MTRSGRVQSDGTEWHLAEIRSKYGLVMVGWVSDEFVGGWLKFVEKGSEQQILVNMDELQLIQYIDKMWSFYPEWEEKKESEEE